MISKYQSYEPSFKIEAFSTDSSIVITNEKIASSFIHKYYNNGDWDKDVHLPAFAISYNDHGYLIKTNFRSEDDDIPFSFKKTLKDVESILEGTCSKDIIICIRNPFDRFISSFSQDYLKPILQSNFISEPYVGSLLRNNFENASELINEFKENSHLFTGDSELNLENIKKVEFQLKEVIKNILKEINISNTPLDRAHNVYHHIPILLLLSISDIKNINIVDIDSENLIDILNKYSDNPKDIGITHSSKELNKFIFDIIHSDEMLHFKDRIEKTLYLETLSYNILKSKKI